MMEYFIIIIIIIIIIYLFIFFFSLFISLQSRPKIVGTLVLYPPSPLINAGKYRVFISKKEKRKKKSSDYQY